MNELRKLRFASVVSELHSSDIYLIFKARLFEASVPNLNDVAVTEAFVDEIVENQEKYISMPLMADIKNLISGNYEKLGHMYDPSTDEFYSTQIGSFYKYEKETVGEHVYLIGYGKVLKRNKAVCMAMSELFATGNLKFSFEVSCSSYSEREDGVMQIDAAEDNYLEAMSIVFNPAYESAVALELVAECTQIFNGEEKGDEKMNTENEILTPEMLNEECVKDKEEKDIPICSICGKPHTPCCRGEEDSCKDKFEQEILENPEEIPDENENATCKKRAEDTLEEPKNKKCCGEGEEIEIVPEEETVESECVKQQKEDAACKKTICEIDDAEEVFEDITTDYATKEDLAKILDAIAKLNMRIEELASTCKKAVSVTSGKTTIKKANPFLSEINTPKKYSLLESDTCNGNYSILNRE